MTAETEKEICEMIEQAEVVADPLEKLVEKAKTDPGAPFEPEVLASLADLEEKQPAQFHKLRAELKAAGVIRNAHAFVLWHAFHRRHSLKAGEYLFERDANAIAIHRRCIARVGLARLGGQAADATIGVRTEVQPSQAG